MIKKAYPGQTEPSIEDGIRIVSKIGEMSVIEFTNKIFAGNKILPFRVPLKGAVQNLMETYFMKSTEDLIENNLLGVPHPRISIIKNSEPFEFNVKVYAYLTRNFYKKYYLNEVENQWGIKIYPGLTKNERLPYFTLIFTGKNIKSKCDKPLSSEKIIELDLASKEAMEFIKWKTCQLFRRGQDMAKDNGLILIHSKYQFGKNENGKIILINGANSPSTSGYWYEDSYKNSFETGVEPKPLLREFVVSSPNFLKKNDYSEEYFSGPFINSISSKYVELYKKIIKSDLYLKVAETTEGNDEDIYKNVCEFLTTEKNKKIIQVLD